MQVPFDDAQFASWRQAAEGTLASARHDRAGGFANWACFKAQQASEFALKSLCRGLGLAAHGHSLIHLRKQLVDQGLVVAPTVQSDLLLLEQFYLATRYPDAQPSGQPDQAYDDAMAATAIAAAQRVLAFSDESRATIASGGPA